MNEDLSLSPKGEQLIKVFESCQKRGPDGNFRPYVCPAGVLTIGWGHTNAQGRHFTADTVWTQAQCDAAFDEDMYPVGAEVRRLVRVELTQHQFDALSSFTYNVGSGALASSTLLRRLNRGDYQGAAREFAKWNKGGGRILPGLVRRRAAEALLFNNVPHEHAVAPMVGYDHGQEAMPQRADEPKPATSLIMKPSTIGAGGIGALGVGDAVQTVNGALDQAQSVKDKVVALGFGDALAHALTNPAFLFALVLIIAAGAMFLDLHKLHQENAG